MRLSTLVASLTLAAAAFTASGHEYEAGPLTIDHPHALELPPSSAHGAAYLVISNRGSSADRLLGAASPIAERVELHTMTPEGGMMKMTRLDGVDLPAGQRIAFAPGGMHVMLMGLKRALAAGDQFPLTLRFERAGEVDVIVNVQARDAPAPAHGDRAGDTGHGAMPSMDHGKHMTR